MKEHSERIDKFKNNPNNFPFIKKENDQAVPEEPAKKKRKRIIPIKFKRGEDIQKTYDTVQRKNPVNINGISKQNNGDAMNVLTAPTQIFINSVITALLSLKDERENHKQKFFINELPKEKGKEKPGVPLGLPFYNDKVGFPNKTFWSDVDWEWANKRYPNMMNASKALSENVQIQSTKLLENGYSIKQIGPNSNEIEIRKAFELIHDKSKELFKSLFKDESKNIKADLSEIKDVQDFVAKINSETGRKMSPLDMVINIILIKEAKGESTEKEREGLFNYIKNENIEIDIKKSTKEFAKSVEKAINGGVLVVGKSMEVAGKAMEVSGKALEASGQAMQATGEALQAVPVIGNAVGGALIAGGAAAEGTGKSLSSAGEGVSKAGDEISKQSEKREKSSLRNPDVKIVGFKKAVKKLIELEQELDKTSQPTQETGIMM